MTIRLPGTPQSWLDKEIAKEDEELFSFELDEAHKSGRYPIPVAAKLLAKSAGHSVSSAKMEERLFLAVHDKSLPAYDMHQTVRWDGEMPFITLLVVYWDDLNTWIKENDPRISPIFQDPNIIAIAEKIKLQTTLPVIHPEPSKPWLTENQEDPKPEQSWYTPARYFARELVREDSTLLRNREKLAKKVVDLLSKVGIKKRGGKKSFDPATIKKAFSNVSLG